MIWERLRSMMSHAKLAKTYWDEAMKKFFYLINRSPLVPLDGNVPQRVWIGKNVSYQHLRVFRCLAYNHVAKDQRSKLDIKSKPCSFLGQCEEEFGYRLWDLVDIKVVRSQDIVIKVHPSIYTIMWRYACKLGIFQKMHEDACKLGNFQRLTYNVTT